MFDFSIDPFQESTAFDWIIFIFVYAVIFVFNKDMIVTEKNRQVSKKLSDRKILCCGLLFFLIYASTRGDFYHYGNMVQTHSVSSTRHMEDVYYWIIEQVGNNYFLWRVIVFGGCFLCFILTSKKLNVSPLYSMLVLSLCYINMFNYARASVAFAIFFFGLSFLISPFKIKSISYVLGIIIMYSAHYFHSSAYFLLSFTPILFIPVSKRAFYLSLVLFPIVVNAIMYLSQFSNDFAVFVEDDKLASKFDYYTDDDLEQRGFYGGLGMFIFYLMHYGSYFLTTLYIGYLVIKKKINNIYIISLYKVLYVILIVSVSMLFSEFGMLFFYRVLYMSIIPLSIALAYLISEGFLRDKHCRWCFNLCMISILYESFRGLYLSILK